MDWDELFRAIKQPLNHPSPPTHTAKLGLLRSETKRFTLAAVLGALSSSAPSSLGGLAPPSASPRRVKFSPVTFLAVLALGAVFLMAAATAQEPPEEARPVQALSLILNPSGFQQKQLTTPAGLTVILIRNRTFETDVDIVIDRVAGERLSTSALRSGRRTLREKVDLTPGDYVIRVLDVPKWTASLTVTQPSGGSQ